MADKSEDLSLPNAIITRLVKETLPDGVIVSKEARTAIGRAASVFVLYATSCANNFAQAQKRKTLLAADVLEALEDMEFGEFLQPLKEQLEAFRKEQKGKKEAAAESKRKKAETASSDDMSPDAKKQKKDSEQRGENEETRKEEAKTDPPEPNEKDESKNGET